MRICFITPEIFAFGYYGGHGKSTRNIGSGLVKRGVEVYVITQQRATQRIIEQIDGMVVLSYPGGLNANSIYKALRSGNFFRMPEADIYHTWDPYFISPYIINRATPKSKSPVHEPLDIFISAFRPETSQNRSYRQASSTIRLSQSSSIT
jgi:hypothetical protein